MRIPLTALLLTWLATCAAYACTRVEEKSAPPDVMIGEGGFGGQGDGGSGSLAGDAGDGHGGGGIVTGGQPASIELGIWPTFAAEPNQTGDADAVLAAISALSAGSATLPIYERWDSLSGATGSPRALTWSRLGDMVAPYRERSRGLALCIGIVDRATPAWPVAGELDSDEALAAIERTIDEVFARFGSELTHLCFGYEIDRYLSSVPKANGTRLKDFLGHAIDYARAHPLRSARTAFGVAITMDAARDPALVDELSLGDEVVAVYDPLDENAELRSPSSAATELDGVLDALPLRDGNPMQLTLLEAGYPASAALGSSEKSQRVYYQTLFTKLEERAAAVAFVGLYGLADRAAADCDAEALAFGSAETERALSRCSMGLRAEGAPKLAWPSVLQALSQYR